MKRHSHQVQSWSLVGRFKGTSDTTVTEKSQAFTVM